MGSLPQKKRICNLKEVDRGNGEGEGHDKLRTDKTEGDGDEF